MLRSRDDALAVLHGRRLPRTLVFGGLPCLTAPGLAAAGVRYAEAHTDAARMAAAAASTYERFGFESAVVPFDLCVEAEALGCGVDFQTDVEGFLPPVVNRPLPIALVEGEASRWPPADILRRGRIPLVADALRRLARGVGREVAIGAWVPGPFTLAWQLFGADAWLGSIGRPAVVAPVLSTLADLLARIAAEYRASGADFITVHEMGGSPQAVGPRAFRALVRPALTRLLNALPAPTVLSMCGDTNAVAAELAACGADALNVDHTNDLARTRQTLGQGAIVLGNFDPVALLSHGAPRQIAAAVESIVAARASAIWPGCDLWPDIPAENFQALMSAAAMARPAAR